MRWIAHGTRACPHATGCSSGGRRGCSRGLSRFRPSRSGQARRVRARTDGARGRSARWAGRTSSRLAAAMPYAFEVMSVRSSSRIADCSMASIRRLRLVIKKPPARTDGYTRRLHKTRWEIVRASAHLIYTAYSVVRYGQLYSFAHVYVCKRPCASKSNRQDGLTHALACGCDAYQVYPFERGC